MLFQQALDDGVLIESAEGLRFADERAHGL